MAKLSEIKLPDNNTYEFKDSDAQLAIQTIAQITVSNRINIIKPGTYSYNGITVVVTNDNYIDVSGTATDDVSILISDGYVDTYNYTSAFFISQTYGDEGSANTWWIELSSGSTKYVSYNDTPTNVPSLIGYLYLKVKSGANLEFIAFRPMLIPLDLYNIGVRSELYAPTNREIYQTLQPIQASVDKIDTSVGSNIKPIYFDDGAPMPCTYTVEKSVPSDAVFTDTTYESKSAESGGTALSLVTTGEKYTWNNKQSTFSSSNKLNPSYINYDATHRAVTDTEKSTWNGKQNALTFDSAPTSNSTNPVTSGGVYTALAGKADSTEVHALDTNITSSTTITAYVDALSKGHYATFFTSSSKPTDAPISDNCFVEIFVYSSSTAYIRVTPTATGYIGSTYELNKVSGNWQTQWVSHGYGMLIPDNTDINTITTIGDYFIGTGTSAETMTNLPASALYSGHLIVSGLNAVNKARVMQTYIPSWNATNKMGKIFVRHLINTNQWTDWVMVSDNVLMAELVDVGAKNLLKNGATSQSTVVVNSDGTMTINGTNSSDVNLEISTSTVLPAGDYVLSASDIASSVYLTARIVAGTQYTCTGQTKSVSFHLDAETQIERIYLFINKNTTISNLTVKPMICTLADYTISPKFVPYVMNNAELTQLHTGKRLSSNIDLDTLLTEGTWYGYNAVGSTASNLPVPNANFNLRVENVMIGGVYLKQTCYIAQIQHVYTEFVRVKSVSGGGGPWQPWEMVLAVGELGWELVKNDDLDNFTTPGFYQCTGSAIGNTLLHSPTVQPFKLRVERFTSTSNTLQEITAVDNTTSGEPVVFRRVKLSSGWKSWYKFTGTAVS